MLYKKWYGKGKSYAKRNDDFMRKMLVIDLVYVLAAPLFLSYEMDEDASPNNGASKKDDNALASETKAKFDFGGGTFTISNLYEHYSLNFGQSN